MAAATATTDRHTGALPPPGAESAAGPAMPETVCRVIAFSAGNVRAVAKSGAILSRGVQAFNQAAIGICRMTWQDGMTASRALAGCRSPKHAAELELDLMRANGSRLVGQGCMLAVMAMQIGEDSVVPLVKRVHAAYDVARDAA